MSTTAPSAAPSSAPVLRREIDTLNHLLEQVIVEQVGLDAFEMLNRLRLLALERRAELPGAESKLAAAISQLSLEQLNFAVRAFSIYFDLANLAEDLQRVRVLRSRAVQSGSQPRTESMQAAIRQLHQAGVSPHAVQRLLDRLQIDLVFTAHPTEAKRRTTRRILRQFRTALQSHGMDSSLAEDRTQLHEQLLAYLTLMWQIDPMRPQRPTVMQEVERGLFFFDGLWQIIPRIHQELRDALGIYYPNDEFHIPAFIRFGSWIGGDRDGNPFVTADVTGQTLQRLATAAIERHLTTCRELQQFLVMSVRAQGISDELRQAVHALGSGGASEIADVEIYRRWLKEIEARLQGSVGLAQGGGGGRAYRCGAELERDVAMIERSLQGHHGGRIARQYIQHWIDQIRTFGLQAAALDVRQDSRIHVDVLTEIFKALGLCENYQTADEATRRQLLLRPIEVGNDLVQMNLSEIARETLSLFKLLARTVRAGGTERLGGHIVSMTHHPSDLLAILWFWKWAWKAMPGDGQTPLAYLPIVPLLETIDDLQRGPQILQELFEIPEYVSYLRQAAANDPVQIVMVGYSDSTKDGGYLAASWGLYRSQEQLVEVTSRFGVRLMLFHGRGGALGRGGGPAARAILSLPPKSVGGGLRMTEQGEVLAERYDDPSIAHRHLEQVTGATLLVSGLPEKEFPEGWFTTLDAIAETSFRKYRALVEDPGFLQYFDQATPISEIERLPIGSRPSRRRERKSLADLRAIPWTFAWTQSRHFIPAWFGLGTALESAVHGDWSKFQQMYLEWPIFTAIIDNANLALAKADLSIAHRYVGMVEDQSVAERVWATISEEFYRTRGAVLLITQQQHLLAGTPWLQSSIQQRNPYVDPLNLIQVELLGRLRVAAKSTDQTLAEELQQAIRLSIQGVASGLRTTG